MQNQTIKPVQSRLKKISNRSTPNSPHKLTRKYIYHCKVITLSLLTLFNAPSTTKAMDSFSIVNDNFSARYNYEHSPAPLLYGDTNTENEFLYTNNVIHASELALKIGLTNSQFHIQQTDYQNEKINQIGFSGNLGRIDYFSGKGQGNISSQNKWSQQDPFHFHGGNTQEYSFTGAHLSTPITNNLYLHLGHASMYAEKLDKRNAFKAGLQNKNYELSFTSIKRAQDTVGKILSMSGKIGKTKIFSQYLKHDNNASMQNYGLQFIKDGKQYSLSFQHKKNPLFDKKNENRLMIGMEFTLNSNLKPTRNNINSITRRTATYGATLASSIALLSSGSSSGDSSQRLTAVDTAAHSALNAINPQSVKENREYGGFIYQNADGSYSSTAMIRGTTNGISFPSPKSLQPAGTRTMASVHTHGGHDPRFNSEVFSPLDLNFNYALGKDGYISTPNGNFKVHRVNTGEILTLGTVAN